MSRIVVIGVVAAVIRVTCITVIMKMHPICQPADRVGRGDAPKEPGRKSIVGRIRVVIDRVWLRVIVIDRPGLVDDNPARFIVRHVDNFRIDRRYFDHIVDLADGLPIIGLQVSCRHRTATKRLDSIEHRRLLIDNGFTEIPCPVEIFVQQSDDFRIVQQRDDRVIPVVIGFQVRILLDLFQIPGGLYNLQWIARGRQNNRDQIIRVQRHRSHQFFELRRRIVDRLFSHRTRGIAGQHTKDGEQKNLTKQPRILFDSKHGNFPPPAHPAGIAIYAMQMIRREA